MDRLSTWEILMCDHSLLSLFKMKGVYGYDYGRHYGDRLSDHQMFDD